MNECLRFNSLHEKFTMHIEMCLKNLTHKYIYVICMYMIGLAFVS